MMVHTNQEAVQIFDDGKMLATSQEFERNKAIKEQLDIGVTPISKEIWMIIRNYENLNINVPYLDKRSRRLEDIYKRMEVEVFQNIEDDYTKADVIATVYNKNKNDYQVSIVDGLMFCDCEDSLYNSNSQERLCKHKIALLKRLNRWVI